MRSQVFWGLFLIVPLQIFYDAGLWVLKVVGRMSSESFGFQPFLSKVKKMFARGFRENWDKSLYLRLGVWNNANFACQVNSHPILYMLGHPYLLFLHSLPIWSLATEVALDLRDASWLNSLQSKSIFRLKRVTRGFSKSPAVLHRSSRREVFCL